MVWFCKRFEKIDKAFFDYGIGAFFLTKNNISIHIILPHKADLKKSSIVKLRLTNAKETYIDNAGVTRWAWDKNIDNITLANSIGYNGVTAHCLLKNHILYLCKN